MAANTIPIFPDVQNVGTKKLTNADGTTIVALFTGGADGSMVDDIIITSDSAAAHDLQIWLNDGAADILLGTVEIPIGAGNTSGVVTVSALSGGNTLNIATKSGSIYVPSGYSVKFGLVAGLAAGKFVYVTAWGGDY